ncbi:MAG: Asp-tRNA(Asn)/Glu-tRNA(Gln) amidotransferase subunit GatC [Bradymonadaceae bacterium]
MTIEADDVRHIAKLARIELEDDEIEQFQSELADIIEYVDKLEELETEDVEPTTHAILDEMVGREDETVEGLPREDVLKNAPDEDEGQFRVPKVVD